MMREEPVNGPGGAAADSRLCELRTYVEQLGTAPTLEAMPRRTLADKGIAGPTAAHVIEEVHTPFNYAFLTVTTGSSAFQNLVGVTASEIPGRVAASARALELAGVKRGARVLITYPPLVNVFTRQGLEAYDVSWSFLRSSGRDALLLALCEGKPDAVVGESGFLRAALEDAGKLGVADLLPKGAVLLAAGTPLDPALAEVAKQVMDAPVHDLYGCQEFGWLTLDGIPVRDDISLAPTGQAGWFHLVVGGLPTGDSFPFMEGASQGHACNPTGKIITYARRRSAVELETTVLASTAAARETVERLARTILRIKAKVVRVAPNLALGAEHTVLELRPPCIFGAEGMPVAGASQSEVEPPPFRIEGPDQTAMFDTLLQAQMDYQAQNKTDPAWIKGNR